jgi:hypothetical protein
VCFGTGYVREAQSRRAQIVVTTCSRVPLTLPSSFPPAIIPPLTPMPAARQKKADSPGEKDQTGEKRK